MKKSIKFGHAEASFDTVGAEMRSFKLDGEDILWYGDPEYWRGCSPVLFPVVCSLKDNKIKIGGKTYEIAKHGFAKGTEFTVVSESENEISFAMTDSDITRACYPFKFELTVTHRISENGFSTAYTVKNRDDKPMVFTIGGHPGFYVGNAEDCRLVFEKDEDAPIIYAEGGYTLSKSAVYSRRLTKVFDLHHADFDRCDALIVREPNSRRVTLENTATGRKIGFDFDGFSALGMWTKPNAKAPYICLEPWNGLPAYDDESGNFEDKPYAVTLPAGEIYSVGFTVTVTK